MFLHILHVLHLSLLANFRHALRAAVLLQALLSGLESEKPVAQTWIPTPTVNDDIFLTPSPTRPVVVTSDTTLWAIVCWVLCILVSAVFLFIWLVWMFPGVNANAVKATGALAHHPPAANRAYRRRTMHARQSDTVPYESRVVLWYILYTAALPAIFRRLIVFFIDVKPDILISMAPLRRPRSGQPSSRLPCTLSLPASPFADSPSVFSARTYLDHLTSLPLALSPPLLVNITDRVNLPVLRSYFDLSTQSSLVPEGFTSQAITSPPTAFRTFFCRGLLEHLPSLPGPVFGLSSTSQTHCTVQDDHIGFYFSLSDLPLLDALLKLRMVLAHKLIDICLGTDGTVILAVRMLITRRGAHPDDIPYDCVVYMIIVPAHDARARFRLWLRDHAVGIMKPVHMSWAFFLKTRASPQPRKEWEFAQPAKTDSFDFDTDAWRFGELDSRDIPAAGSDETLLEDDDDTPQLQYTYDDVPVGDCQEPGCSGSGDEPDLKYYPGEFIFTFAGSEDSVY